MPRMGINGCFLSLGNKSGRRVVAHSVIGEQSDLLFSEVVSCDSGESSHLSKSVNFQSHYLLSSGWQSIMTCS